MLGWDNPATYRTSHVIHIQICVASTKLSLPSGGVIFRWNEAFLSREKPRKHIFVMRNIFCEKSLHDESFKRSQHCFLCSPHVLHTTTALQIVQLISVTYQLKQYGRKTFYHVSVMSVICINYEIVSCQCMLRKRKSDIDNFTKRPDVWFHISRGYLH